MRLNTLSPAIGSKKKAKRVGRGIGSTLGKTCGRGHKGQKSRSGGQVKPGFEGGQQPLQRRLPKFGFTSKMAKEVQEIRLGQLMKINEDVIDFAVIKKNKLISHHIKRVKIILSGEIKKAVTLKGVAATKGARSAIENAGGKIEA